MIALETIEKLLATEKGIEERYWLTQVGTSLKQIRAAESRARRLWKLIKDKYPGAE